MMGRHQTEAVKQALRGSGNQLPASVSASVLVGRESELARALEGTERAPSFIHVEGEPGVGKSRFANEVLKALADKDLLVLSGRCYPMRDSLSLAPVIDALTGLRDRDFQPPEVTGTLRRLLPEIAHRLPPDDLAFGERGIDTHQTYRALIELLGCLGPAVLALDDIHWIDGMTADFLLHLAAHCPNELRVVLSLRPDESIQSVLRRSMSARVGTTCQTTTIRLSPLDVNGVQALVGTILGSAEVSPAFAAYIHEATGGLPFAVEETLALLQHRGDLLCIHGRWTRKRLANLEVPVAVRDSVRERFSSLSEHAQRVLEAACIVGVGSTEPLLALVTGFRDDRLNEGLDASLRSGLLLESAEGVYEYRHALAAQAIYETLSGPALRGLHLKTAEALEELDDDSSPALARHYRRAGRVVEWVDHAEKAADRAMELGDHRTAASLLQELFTLSEMAPEAQVRLAPKLGSAALHGLAQEEAISVLRPLIEQLPLPPVVKGELRLYLGMLYAQGGDAASGRRELKTSVTELRDDPTLRARALKNVAVLWGPEGTADEHIEAIEKAQEIAAQQPNTFWATSVAVDRAYVLTSLGLATGWEAAGKIPPAGKNIDLTRERTRGLSNLAQAGFYLGHYERSADMVRESRRIAQVISYTRCDSALSSTQLLLDWATGCWDDLPARATALIEEASVPHAATEAELVLGLLFLAQGRLEEAEQVLTDVRIAAEPAGAIPTLAMAAAGLTRLHLERGNRDGALVEATRAFEIVVRKEIWVWASEILPAAVQALMSAGRLGEANGYVTRVARGLKEKDSPLGFATLWLARAHLLQADTEAKGVKATYSRAHKMLDELPRPFDAALALEAGSRHLLEIGDSGGQKGALKALQRLTDLGATWDAARVRQLLRRHGVSVPRVHTGGRKSYEGELSPREEEIASLAAAGHTNREIAEMLFISHRTVEAHIRAALSKLGLGSKRELASLSQEHSKNR